MANPVCPITSTGLGGSGSGGSLGSGGSVGVGGSSGEGGTGGVASDASTGAPDGADDASTD